MNIKKINLISIFIFSIFSFLGACQLKLGIIDTTYLDEFRYQPFIDITSSVGFDIDYKSIAQVMDSDSQELDLNQYDGVLFLIGIEFLKGMPSSVVGNQVFSLIESFSKNSNKLIGFVFPTISNAKINKAFLLAPFFQQLGLSASLNTFVIPNLQSSDLNQTEQMQEKNSLASLFQVTNRFLDIPMEVRSFLYHKTLSSPVKKPLLNLAETFEKKDSSYFATLPIKKDFSEMTKSTLPYAIYWFDAVRKNHLFITSATALSFSGISESFHVCPTDFNLRKKLHGAIQETMWELNQIINQGEKDLTKNGINYEKIKSEEKPELPQSVDSIGQRLIVNPAELNDNFAKKIAWMEIYMFDDLKKDEKISEQEFEKQKEKRIKQQGLLIDCILKSGTDALWITFNPHAYYSVIARQKAEEEKFWRSVSLFTKKLKEAVNESGQEVPKILIGYEITNNVYEPNRPKDFAIDLYGNEYIDVPNPLSKSFWKNEVKDPLIPFLEKWKQPEISNGIPISGVVLDLEMYGRMQAGSFLATMGFCQDNLKNFYESKGLDIKVVKDTNKNIEQLEEKKMVQGYFNFLDNQATLLGQNLKDFFDEQIPNCVIACYAPSISIDWFYKGFYRGLSSPQKQLQLLTFNSEFKSYDEWLKNNGIYISHSCVLMLSKLRTKKDFQWLDYILKHNHGMWLNRFSRFSEESHTAWMRIEQSALPKKDTQEFFDYLKTK